MSIKKFAIGQEARSKLYVDQEFLKAFADLSGDKNPLHLDPEFAKRTKFRRPIAHGLSYTAIVSRIIGMELPGPGALWVSQQFEFHLPVYVDDEIEIVATVKKISESIKSLDLSIITKNQRGEMVMSGSATVQLLDIDDPSEKSLENEVKRTALVIGGSRGIGASIVERLAKDEFEVAVTYQNSEGELASLANNYKSIVGIKANVADIKTAPIVLNSIISQFGKAPDTVVLCASSPIVNERVMDYDYASFQEHLDVSLRGNHTLLQCLMPSMVENKFGKIIGISSTFSMGEPPEKMAPYIIAKSVLNTYLKCLAIDYGPFGINTNIVAPSMTESAMLVKVPERQIKVAAAKNPLRRLGKPKDVASAVSFLASREADYINGETLVVSGGSFIR